MNSYSNRRWTSKIVKQRLRIPSTHSKAGTTVRCQKFSGEIQGESEESQPAEPTDDAEAQNDFGSIQGDFIYRHHEPRVQLQVPKGETFTIPLKYIDVTKSTHTDLDVLQEKKIDDCWNVDPSKHLSDSWRGFTKFTKTDEDSNDCQTRSCTATNMDENW